MRQKKMKNAGVLIDIRLDCGKQPPDEEKPLFGFQQSFYPRASVGGICARDKGPKSLREQMRPDRQDEIGLRSHGKFAAVLSRMAGTS
jgi:hypothetical protein